MRHWQLKTRAKQQIHAYLKEQSNPRLHVGSGPNFLPGWLNADLRPVDHRSVFLDATTPFPLPGNSFEAVFSEHLIEHLPYADGQVMLRESLRILRPGGRIRIATPNLENLVTLISNRSGAVQTEYVDVVSSKYLPWNKGRQAAHVVTNFFWDFGHVCVYDPPSLEEALSQAGFTQITQVADRESTEPSLANLECHGQVVGDRVNRFETMVFEAVKSA